MQPLPAIFPPGLDQRPRRVKLRAWSSGLGVWAIRLFILPHTIAGVGMIGWLLATITWVIFGTTQAAPVTMLDTYTSKGKTYYRTTYRYTRKDEASRAWCMNTAGIASCQRCRQWSDRQFTVSS